MVHPTDPAVDSGLPPPTVGIVAALWIEGLAMRSLIDDIAPLPSIQGDPNHYYQGTVPSTDADHPHQIVVTTLPRDNTRNAAAISTDLIRSFPSVHCVLMTGIAGGIPSPDNPSRHVRLGDVVVATKGVVDIGHVIQRDGAAYPRRQVDGMSQELSRAANELAAKDFEGVRPWDEWLTVRGKPKMRNFARPPDNTDILYLHGQQVEHPSRRASGHPARKPKIHYAAIGSSDMLLRDERLRDQIAQDFGVVAVEMEGSGIAVGSANHGKQWFMVRGISDYCDNVGKGDAWQPYASLVAAAYARAVLGACHPFDRSRSTARRQPPRPAVRSDWAQRVADTLVRVPFWHEVANRRNLVTLLRTRLRQLPDLSDQDPAVHLGQIVQLCVNQEYGLTALRASLSAMPGAGKVGPALALIDAVTVTDLFPPRRIAQLVRLLASAAVKVDVAAVWERTAGPLTEDQPLFDDTPSTVRDFAGKPASVNNVRALLAFIAEIARLADDAGSPELTRWLDTTIGQLTWLPDPAEPQPLAPSSYPTGDNTTKATRSTSAMEKSVASLSAIASLDPARSRFSQLEAAAAQSAIPPRQVESGAEHDPPAVWNVPPRNLNFTGREELLASLHSQLSEGELVAVLPQALHGLGGVGKTQLAIEYVYRHQSDYDVIWWIPAEQPQQILQALGELAQRLGLNVGPEANTVVAAVKEALRKGEPYAKWLLVFDNAEEAEHVEQSIPTGGGGKVLVTSRNGEWLVKARSLEVDVFDRSESINLLRRRDSDISDEHAGRLAEALGDLPLAVEQAAAWRAATGMAVDEYLSLLHQKQPELLRSTATAGYERSVAAVWTVSLDRLEEINPAALQLLEVCAYFAPEPISRSLFTSSRPTISPPLDETLRDPIKLGRALRDIQRFSLARVDHRNDTVQLHRLVQAVLTARIPAERQERFRHGAHELLAAANPRQPEDTRLWDRYAALVAHVKVSDAVRCQDPWVQALVFDVVRYLYLWGDHQGCQELAQDVFETWREMLGPDHPESLRIARYFGYILMFNGQYARAREIHEDALRRYAQAQSSDEDVLEAKLMVALDLRAAGRFEESLQLDRSVLADCERLIGEDEPLTLQAAAALGSSLRLAGRYREALELDTRTIMLRAQLLGDNHIDTLDSVNGLNIDRRECGDYQGARAEQETLYQRYVALLGAANPATLRAGRNLAVSRRRAGDHEGALELSLAVEEHLRNRYGSGSSDTMAAALNLATDLRQNNDLHGSSDRATRVLAEYGRTMGETHPFTLAARTNLAVTLRLLGKVEDALDHDLAAHGGLRDSVGPQHVWTLVAAINLASDRYALGEYQRAFELNTETLENARRILGPDHPTTLACNANLALDLRALGRLGEANAVHADVVSRCQQVLGEQHPGTLAVIRFARADCDIDPLQL